MDHRMSFDRPREAGTPPDTPMHATQLWVLAQRLEGQRLDVELSDQRLVVRNPQGGEPTASVTVVCRARTDDSGRPWFFTAAGAPIAEADRITDAALMIKCLLARSRP